jgi:enhancing lycopene biosynthesis protein 2
VKKKKFLVILAGCGAKDGAEIHESVISLLSIDREGAEYEIAAPNIEQKDVLNFIDGSELNEKRNVMLEAARIARGKIKDLSKLSMEDYDVLLIPGGFGAAKNLCSYAYEGIKASVIPDLKRLINEAYDQSKPIGAICIAPVIVALSLAKKNPNIILSLGTDTSANADLEAIGVRSKACLTTEACIDKVNKIISSPAYMHGKSRISELEQGISKLVRACLASIDGPLEE